MFVLIIGSKGFIGSHLVNYFSSKKYKLIGADVVADYESENYFKISDSSIDFDLLIQKYCFAFCINASGAASVPNSLKNPHEDFLLNTINVHYILEAIRKYSPETKFINLSSAAVYGNPIKLPISETTNLSPISPYGFHKKMAEDLCVEYNKNFGLNTAFVRIFSAYGEGLTKQLFWDIYQKSKNNIDLELFGTGKETRDFIHVSDVCKAIDIIFLKGNFVGEAYNLASGMEVTIEEALKGLLENINWVGKYYFNQKTREGDPLNWRADITKLKSLGFEPSISFQQGIKQTAKWLLEKK